MGDSDELVNYIRGLLNTFDESAQEQDPFKKVESLRNVTSQLYAEALESNDERFASLLLKQHLDVYQDAVIDPDSVNNYCEDVIALLETRNNSDEQDDNNGLPGIGLGDPLNYLTDKRSCRGRFEDCSSWELSLKNNVNDEPKCSYTAKSSSHLPGISKLKSVAVEEISRRVFAPTTSSFTPKIPSARIETTGVSNNNEMSSECSEKGQNINGNSFRTAKDELQIQNIKKYGNINPPGQTPLFSYGKKSLGGRRTLGSKFVCPVRQEGNPEVPKPTNSPASSSHSQNSEEEEVDERLRHIEPKMIELIRSEIMDRFSPLCWDDIAGLEYAKTIIQEAVVWPILRPDIFTGLRKPPRGILLFGPPGTGKTLIGKCIASQSKSTFFSISASSLTSKWIGDGEKMVRALFAVAAVHQPAVVFIDEIDSLLCQRSETEHESSRRLKTEFLIQLDGAATAEDDRILIVGATNRPQELDEAARRRMVKRLYIPLPELPARIQILSRLLANEKNSLTPEEVNEIGKLSEGFSGADMKVLCHEASMGPIRSIPFDQLGLIGKDDVRPVSYADFRTALGRVRASVSQSDLSQYVKWDQMYGSGASNVL
ncbi:fidgetin-like protein 1 isoform X2 [Wyeomyia smithii]|uniref:fidgetin-like protein 1 isoform X2 n=1 Tax=Wyeomyia smithii TaxID=174621 RepID=UPI002467D4DA|nr:fidgetin-like protein 1 isoform X2 [Wyeomyia smithii]